MNKNFVKASADRALPPGIARNMWAQALWYRAHDKGPILVVFRMHPLPVYVAGWIPWGGSKCIPQLVGCFLEENSTLVEEQVSRLGEEMFAVGPSIDLIRKAASISEAYRKNGEKRWRAQSSSDKEAGPSKKTAASPTARNWREVYPGWSFGHSESGRVTATAPLGGRCHTTLVVDICDNPEGRDLSWWNAHGPTPEMPGRFKSFVQMVYSSKAV
jgi:hypothetical protein